uniref:ABC transporter domain-containing protein n=1 Tax=Chromera velia CCMP2878 TaxID=1169474 RepID=A0A0G4HIJ4_9ALVE|mmetsp:Transcript_46073/g.90803  ORF Transcript_46073/g.90803 Transcript_46073/m.90803 type:complete len:688 (-) Transcript_46073:1477-3540(-)|eukprot:Cvel_27972.t1-p1 / transcript=Cvel_27972.t1 / gene=Cvel_27972 / organism=Chromera_velia_CCMP2878 / gene_product=ABC transporter G family member 22, putative / transcript_product=ABC transporter G family member 22, putative / location=Cvel_scaffold3575:3898-11050(-) / protein_length=687 / sequence_SO=supercontig / SO=protein_coding / is_pseudo=false
MEEPQVLPGEPSHDIENPPTVGEGLGVVGVEQVDSPVPPEGPSVGFSAEVANEAPKERPTGLGSMDLRKELDEVKEDLKGIGNGNSSPDFKRSIVAFGNATLTFKDVSFSITDRVTKEEKLILSPVSGEFKPGELVAIMGPSGCGKTTLMDILSGRKTSKYTGQILLNGRERDPFFRRITGYVSQQDIMPAHWTVEEAVRFNQVLKNVRPAKLKEEDTNQMVQMALEMLGLDQVKDSLIGNEKVRGISGGQKRRVTLARGMVAGAQILFCDEPTSGLSATDAEICVRAMKLLTKKLGMLIIVVIHQPRPEVAALFDKVMLLTANPGRVVYQGPMAEAAAYWGAAGHAVPNGINPADYFLDTITPGGDIDYVEDLLKHYDQTLKADVEAQVAKSAATPGMTALELLEHRREQRLAFGDLPPIRKTMYEASYTLQYKVLMRRKLVLTFRNTRDLVQQLAIEIMKGLLLGLAFFDIGNEAVGAQLPFVFMLLQSGAMAGMLNMPRLVEERTIMKMETSEALYSEWVHVIVNFIVNSVISVIGFGLFFIVMWALSGIEWEHSGTVFGWGLLLFVVFDGLFTMVAGIAKDASGAQQMALPFLLVFMIYNGFFVRRTTVVFWLEWLVLISPFFWAFQEIVVTMFEGSPQGDKTIEEFGLEPMPYVALPVLLGELVIFRILGGIFLAKLNNIEK